MVIVSLWTSRPTNFAIFFIGPASLAALHRLGVSSLGSVTRVSRKPGPPILLDWRRVSFAESHTWLAGGGVGEAGGGGKD